MTELRETLSASSYFAPEFYERERQEIFARQWIFAAHEHELSAPKGFLTIEVAGYSIVLVRDKEGVVHGHHNVCRHRAAMLVTEDKGVLKHEVLRCPYHGWSYDLSGRFVSGPYIGASAE